MCKSCIVFEWASHGHSNFEVKLMARLQSVLPEWKSFGFFSPVKTLCLSLRYSTQVYTVLEWNSRNLLQQFWGAARVCCCFVVCSMWHTRAAASWGEFWSNLLMYSVTSWTARGQNPIQWESKQKHETSNFKGITVHNYYLKEVDNLWLGL